MKKKESVFYEVENERGVSQAIVGFDYDGVRMAAVKKAVETSETMYIRKVVETSYIVHKVEVTD